MYVALCRCTVCELWAAGGASAAVESTVVGCGETWMHAESIGGLWRDVDACGERVWAVDSAVGCG